MAATTTVNEHIWIPLGLGFNSPVTLLVSQHRDANWLNVSAERLGYRIVRGSSTRGGSEAIRKLKEISVDNTIVITPDGPTGPRREFSMGAAYLASTLNLPIIPMGVGFDRPWELKTWDKFKIPVPGRQARVVFGPPIYIPRKSRKPALESYAKQIGQHMDKLCDFCHGWARRNDSYEGQYRHGIFKTWVKQKIALSDYPVPDFNLQLQPPGKQPAQRPLKSSAA